MRTLGSTISIAIAGLCLAAGTAAAGGGAECAAPSTCRAACATGDQAACTWLGTYYTSGADMVERVQYSRIGVRYFEEACRKGFLEACGQLPALERLLADEAQSRGGAADPPDDKRLDALRDRACKGGYADACTDGKQRVALLEKACAKGRADACFAASSAYEPDGTKHPEDREPHATADDDDPPPPPPEDDGGDESGGDARQAAIDEARKAGILGVRPVKPDAKKSKQLRDRGLALVARACAHKDARTCAANPSRRPDDLARACTAGAAIACRDRAFAGLGLDDLADPKRPQNKQVTADFVTYATQACDLGDFIACEALSGAYRRGEHGVPSDAAKADALEARACDAHDGTACAMVARRVDAADPAKALALYQRSCDEGEPYGCLLAGDAIAAGTHGATKDAAKAAAAYERACDLQYPDVAAFRPICSELAAKNPARAKELRAKGCRGGEKKACRP